jgi:hypothetical protein
MRMQNTSFLLAVKKHLYLILGVIFIWKNHEVYYATTVNM